MSRINLPGYENLAGFTNLNAQFRKTRRGEKNLNLTSKFSNILPAATLLLLFLYWFSLPLHLFSNPCSLLVTASDESLLGARIAPDGQWRFPQQAVPEKFAKCIVAFEDKRFYNHIGIDPVALSRALFQNIKSGRKISGASTLTMQVIRLYRKNHHRTFFEKAVEMILATRLELSYSKKQILSFYAANAPFGGNVVGLEAASWRYFNKPSQQLSWSESATLAVLPNSPSLVHPGKNRHVLQIKRDRLLLKLWKTKIIDSTDCALARLEQIPPKPFPLPERAPQLTDRASELWPTISSQKTVIQSYRSTINATLQQNVNHILAQHEQKLNDNGVYNVAVLVADVGTGDVLAYAGNFPRKAYGGLKTREISSKAADVDNVPAPRSTGSILKPLLYASMLDNGELLPTMLVPDVPTYIYNFTPKNYNNSYEGAVPAAQALARSLNIPAVHLLRQYSPVRFVGQLRRLGLTTIQKSGDHYGLSLILGGAEASLWDLAGVYCSMARTLRHYKDYNSRYISSDFRALNLEAAKTIAYESDKHYLHNAPILGAGATWLTFDAMVKVARPDEQKFWYNFKDARKVAWKTGTSFGNRDAWAIGCTPDYVVAVWVGNSNGEGRPGLTGLSSAAPILFDIFNGLPIKNPWFSRPDGDLTKVAVCRQSGYPASSLCPDTDEQLVSAKGTSCRPCPYHKMIHLDRSGKYRVHSDCESVANMQHTVWFILPPIMSKYYRNHHPDYAELPSYRKDCLAWLQLNRHQMNLIYPGLSASLFLPVNLAGETQNAVFEAAHSRKTATIYWHLDDCLIGITENGNHQLAVNASPGKHILTLVDDEGEILSRNFEVIEKNNRAERQ